MTKIAHSYIIILCYRLIDLFSSRLLIYIKEFLKNLQKHPWLFVVTRQKFKTSHAVFFITGMAHLTPLSLCIYLSQ